MKRTFNGICALLALLMSMFWLLVAGIALFEPQDYENYLTVAVITFVCSLLFAWWFFVCIQREKLMRIEKAIIEIADKKAVFFVDDVAAHYQVTRKQARKILDRFKLKGGQRLYHDEETSGYSLKPIRKRHAVGNCETCGSSSWKQNRFGHPYCEHCGTRR